MSTTQLFSLSHCQNLFAPAKIVRVSKSSYLLLRKAQSGEDRSQPSRSARQQGPRAGRAAGHGSVSEPLGGGQLQQRGREHELDCDGGTSGPARNAGGDNAVTASSLEWAGKNSAGCRASRRRSCTVSVRDRGIEGKLAPMPQGRPFATTSKRRASATGTSTFRSATPFAGLPADAAQQRARGARRGPGPRRWHTRSGGSRPRRQHLDGARGSGSLKRRSKRTRNSAQGMVTSSCVGVTTKTRAAKGPAWDSSSTRDAGVRSDVLVASVGRESLPAFEGPTVAGGKQLTHARTASGTSTCQAPNPARYQRVSATGGPTARLLQFIKPGQKNSMQKPTCRQHGESKQTGDQVLKHHRKETVNWPRARLCRARDGSRATL